MRRIVSLLVFICLSSAASLPAQIATLAELKQELRRAKTPLEKLRAHQKLAYHNLPADTATARSHFRAAQELHESDPASAATFWQSLLAGRIALAERRLPTAKQQLLKAQAIARKQRDLEYSSRALAHLGEFYLVSGRIDSAEHCLSKAATKVNDPHFRGLLQIHLAQARMAMDANFDEVKKGIDYARSLFKQAEEWDRMGPWLMLVEAERLMIWDSLEAARYLADKAHQDFQVAQAPNGIMATEMLLAQLHFQAGRFEDANALVGRLIQEIEMKNTPEKGRLLELRGEMRLQNKDAQKGRADLQAAAAQYAALGMQYPLAEVQIRMLGLEGTPFAWSEVRENALATEHIGLIQKAFAVQAKQIGAQPLTDSLEFELQLAQAYVDTLATVNGLNDMQLLQVVMGDSLRPVLEAEFRPVTSDADYFLWIAMAAAGILVALPILIRRLRRKRAA